MRVIAYKRDRKTGNWDATEPVYAVGTLLKTVTRTEKTLFRRRPYKIKKYYVRFDDGEVGVVDRVEKLK